MVHFGRSPVPPIPESWTRSPDTMPVDVLGMSTASLSDNLLGMKMRGEAGADDATTAASDVKSTLSEEAGTESEVPIKSGQCVGGPHHR